MGLVLENPHDGQNSSCHTGVPQVYLQGPEFSICHSRLGTWGFTNLSRLFSVLEQSCPEGKPDTSLPTQHWFLISTQRKRKKCQKLHNHFLAAAKQVVPGSLCQKITLTPISGKDQRVFISNGLRLHSSQSSGDQLHHHPDFTASYPMAGRAGNDEECRFLLPWEDYNTHLGFWKAWGLLQSKMGFLTA